MRVIFIGDAVAAYAEYAAASGVASIPETKALRLKGIPGL
jgi:hypothetical protein